MAAVQLKARGCFCGRSRPHNVDACARCRRYPHAVSSCSATGTGIRTTISLTAPACPHQKTLSGSRAEISKATVRAFPAPISLPSQTSAVSSSFTRQVCQVRGKLRQLLPEKREGRRSRRCKAHAGSHTRCSDVAHVSGQD